MAAAAASQQVEACNTKVGVAKMIWPQNKFTRWDCLEGHTHVWWPSALWCNWKALRLIQTWRRGNY